MTDDLRVQFAQMQQYTAALHHMMTFAQAQAPRESEGADRSGTVRVTLGGDGLPTAFEVDNGWTRRLTPEQFGGAVMDAVQAAIGDRMERWTRALEEDGWQQQVDRLKGGPAAAPTEGRVPPAFRKPVEQVTPRRLDEVTEDVFKAFDNVDAFAAMPRTEGASGTDASGKLTITLSGTGMTACTADERWVTQQTSAKLMNALSEALRAAKGKLATMTAKPEPAGGMDRLFAEAMALLNDPRKLAD